MSGGVDSSVAALVLKEQGHEVIGVSMRLFSCNRVGARSCCTERDRADARTVCERLDIPYHIVDMTGRFRTEVVEPFLDAYLADTRSAGAYYSPRTVARGALKLLFRYLIEIKAVKPLKLARVKKPYDWLLDPYLQHLQDECGFSPGTLQRVRAQVGSFLDMLGRTVQRHRFKTLRAEAVEDHLNRQTKDSPEN